MTNCFVTLLERRLQRHNQSSSRYRLMQVERNLNKCMSRRVKRFYVLSILNPCVHSNAFNKTFYYNFFRNWALKSKEKLRYREFWCKMFNPSKFNRDPTGLSSISVLQNNGLPVNVTVASPAFGLWNCSYKQFAMSDLIFYPY